MVSLPSSSGGMPTSDSQDKRSFADVLMSGGPGFVRNSNQIRPANSPSNQNREKLSTGLHKGSPAAFFADSVIDEYAQPLKWVIIGKLSQGFNKSNPKLGRPPIEIIEKFFVSLDLKVQAIIGLMDNRHITIQLGCEEDFLRIYSKSSWVVDGKLMRIFKWHTEFHVEKESTLYPAWISLPRLPLHFFNREALFTMMSLVGNPLRIDGATATLKRPSLAKVQVEVDLLKEIPEKIWIGTGQSGGFWQKLEVDYLPPYCVHCWHVGHSEEQCIVKFPELKPVGQLKRVGLSNSRWFIVLRIR